MGKSYVLLVLMLVAVPGGVLLAGLHECGSCEHAARHDCEHDDCEPTKHGHDAGGGPWSCTCGAEHEGPAWVMKLPAPVGPVLGVPRVASGRSHMQQQVLSGHPQGWLDQGAPPGAGVLPLLL